MLLDCCVLVWVFGQCDKAWVQVNLFTSFEVDADGGIRRSIRIKVIKARILEQ